MYVGVKREPIVVILLSIITCGIYGIYWYYVCGSDLNQLAGEQKINLVPMLIFMLICAPVAWYWLYKLDEGLEEISTREGLTYKRNFIMWLLLTFVLGVGVIVAMFQIQSGFNAIWRKRSA